MVNRGMIIGVDPALRSTGVSAVYADNGDLIWSTVFKVKKGEGFPFSLLAEQVLQPPFLRIKQVVIEAPSRRPWEKTDPQILIDINRLGGEIGGFLRAFMETPAMFITAQKWKGTIKKEIKLAQIEKGLTEEEKAKVPRKKKTSQLEPDAVDSIGIAKWAFKNLK